jgi:CO/xanthine dehydrogenase Mo-binding subunit
MKFGAGQRTLRTKDRRLVTGRGNFVDDQTEKDTLHLAVLRSNVAHAPIHSVDVSVAKSRPGVIAAFGGKELLEAGVRAIPKAIEAAPGPNERDRCGGDEARPEPHRNGYAPDAVSL